MDIIKFKSSSNVQNKIAFCFIDTHRLYPNNWLKELVKNTADFEIGRIHGEGFDIFVGYNEDYLLNTLSKEYEYAVISAIGTSWGIAPTFFPLINHYCNTEDFYLLGHILDKKEAYYELHNQCYVINLKYHKQLNFPVIGTQSLYDPHIQTAPVRSDDNYHDDYTPKWVTAGNEQKSYGHKCHGWNIISQALENNLPVHVFNEELRNSKRYLYPDNNASILSSLSEYYVENNVASRNWINPFSTANHIEFPVELPGKLRYFVTPALGLDFVHYLDHYGFDEHTVVRFTDYNLLSLEFMKSLVAWDGKSYVDFLHNFSKGRSEFLSLPSNAWLGIKDGLESKWKEFESKYDFQNFWNEIRSKVKFEYRYKDFLHYEGPYGKDNGYWIDETLNHPCTLINLNHVFNYHSTSVFYTLKYRVEIENYTIERMKEKIPNAHVVFEDRAWKGFREYNTNSLHGKVKDLEIISMSDLKRPSWHYNDDWI